MQTTGRANYRRMGQKCNVEFEEYPELVLSAQHALKPALAEWTQGNLNAAADRDDIRAITKRINGGYNGLDDRIDWLRKVKPLIGVVTLNDGPAPAPAQPAAPSSFRRGTVNVPILNMRKEPDAASQRVQTLAKNDRFEIIGEQMNGDTKWLHVNLGSGKSGWVAARYVVETR